MVAKMLYVQHESWRLDAIHYKHRNLTTAGSFSLNQSFTAFCFARVRKPSISSSFTSYSLSNQSLWFVPVVRATECNQLTIVSADVAISCSRANNIVNGLILDTAVLNLGFHHGAKHIHTSPVEHGTKIYESSAGQGSIFTNRGSIIENLTSKKAHLSTLNDHLWTENWLFVRRTYVFSTCLSGRTELM
jgi:hypothetical protein